MTTDQIKDYAVAVCEHGLNLDMACIRQSLPPAYEVEHWHCASTQTGVVDMDIVVIDDFFDTWAVQHWKVEGRFNINWRYPGTVSKLYRRVLTKRGNLIMVRERPY